MMQRLLILGARDLGLEIYSWLHDVIDISWHKVGFLDDTLGVDFSHLPGQGLIGTISDYQPQQDDVFICAIANPAAKLKICQALKIKGANFVNLIHKTAVIAQDCQLGEGVVIFPYVYVSRNTIIGNYINLNVFVCIGHDVLIGDACTLSPHCDVTGHVKLGKGVFMGTQASIVPKLTIGDFAVLGAGSLNFKSVPDNVTVIGNTAKILIKHVVTEQP